MYTLALWWTSTELPGLLTFQTVYHRSAGERQSGLAAVLGRLPHRYLSEGEVAEVAVSVYRASRAGAVGR